jgi:biopolymer transport protein ExbB
MGMKMRTWLVAVLFTAVSMTLCLGTSEASEWWNEQWQYRKKVSFDATPTGADLSETQTDVPVLVRLHLGNFEFEKAEEDLKDLRFLSADGITVLKHHIERFDPLEDVAFVWVNVPRIAASGVPSFVYMYYGNPNAAEAQERKGTYNVAYSAVYHFNEIETPPSDFTAYENDVIEYSGAQGLPSVIGTGFAFNGAGDFITLPAHPSLEFQESFTFEAWIKVDQPQNDAVLYVQENDRRVFLIGIDGTELYLRNRKLNVEGEGDAAVVEDYVPEGIELALGTWQHLAVTATRGRGATIYINGAPVLNDANAAWPGTIDAPIRIGSSSQGENYFFGEIDEMRISSAARPASWFKAVFAGEGPDQKLFQWGIEEVGEGAGGLPVFYLNVIFKNITLDGWIVIGLLMMFLFVSSIIFTAKLFYLMSVGKDNRDFNKDYRKDIDPLSIDHKSDEYDNSTLFRVYREGLSDMVQRVGDVKTDSGPKKVEKGIIESFKVALEEGFVRESQRLNARLVFLTMAITGGPFLGLLGTVWGVMNTFAAMAEAGEANIMAIAPGVASALSTTVIGLMVAIPSLFAYNFLATKVKNITADTIVFIDQLNVNVEQTYGDK